jgi:long-chain fatty acid transport protein
MAMAGAFVAVADDPSALFWNPAGIAFQMDKGTQIMGGATLISAAQDFTGDDPYPGAGYTASQIDQVFFPTHFYIVTPLGERTSFGFSILTPYGLGTWWEDDHRGRFISKRADLKTFDFSPNLGFKLTENLAFGIGVDYRTSTIDLTRNLGILDPFTQSIADVGQVHLFTEGLSNDGWGWHASLLGDLGAGFSLGILYRSGVTVDYRGKASFTQYLTGNPNLDAIVAATLPFDDNPTVVTQIEFPDFVSVGLSWSNEKWTVSGQWGQMGWSSFQELPLIFPENPELNSAVEENYENVNQYRLGAEYRISEPWRVQAGVLFDETPQPTESMSPLLGDGDRTGLTLGFSWHHGNFWVDVGYMHLEFDERGTGGNSLEGYEGTYKATAELGGATLGFTF